MQKLITLQMFSTGRFLFHKVQIFTCTDFYSAYSLFLGLDVTDYSDSVYFMSYRTFRAVNYLTAATMFIEISSFFESQEVLML